MKKKMFIDRIERQIVLESLMIFFVSFLTITRLVGQPIEEQIEGFNSLGISKKIEFLRSEIEINKTRFDKMNLVLTGQFKKTSDPYGPMYLITDKHEKRYYRLDIAGERCSSEFIRVYLESLKLKSIYRVTKESEKSLYGENGKRGVVIMRFRNLRGINTDKCGFHLLDKDHGDNYTIFIK